MSTTFALMVGAIAGALAHFVGRGDGLGLMAIVVAAVGLFLGWTAVGILTKA
jgi:hypothetical protein